MKLKEIPFYNRPRERLKRSGVSVLSDAEVLALVLGSGVRGSNVLDLSNRLLKQGLRRLSSLSLQELQVLKGVGFAKACQLKALFEFSNRFSKLERNGYSTIVRSSEDVHNMFYDELKDKKREHLYVLLLDTKNKVIGRKLVSVGTLNQSLVHPREVFKEAIKASANAIILVHNHPSGDCEPSAEDEEITRKMREAGEVVGVKVLDHVIVGTGQEDARVK